MVNRMAPTVSALPSGHPPIREHVVTAAISSSGGKDSLLALHRARAIGLDVTTMITMFDRVSELSKSHGVPRHLVESQARALGLDSVTPPSSWTDYQDVFVETLATLRNSGHTTIIFGDIDLQPHRDWEEMVCALTDLTPLLPLWGESRSALARETVDLGFEAIVVCVDSRYLTDDFAGRRYDAAFLNDLPAHVDPCGENGEFHTFVTNGPGFSRALDATVAGQRVYTSPPEFGSQRYCFAELT
jgi:diphthine-ammonia ligase